jgi:hypothetical protein
MDTTPHPRRGPRPLVAGIALLLAACGSAPSASTATSDAVSSPTIAPAGSVDAGGGTGDLCAIVPKELAEAAMGGPVADGEGGDLFPDGSYCVFGTDDAAVRVEVQRVEMTREAFDTQAGSFGLTETTNGAGEAAFVRETSVQGEAGTWLYAFGDGAAIGVDIQGPDDQAAQLEAARAIVAAVLAASD